MQYSHNIHFTDGNELPDDIDCLFELLPQVAPPSSLIKRILEQTPMTYAYDAFPVSQPCYFQGRLAAKRSLEGLETTLCDMRHKRSYLC